MKQPATSATDYRRVDDGGTSTDAARRYQLFASAFGSLTLVLAAGVTYLASELSVARAQQQSLRAQLDAHMSAPASLGQAGTPTVDLQRANRKVYPPSRIAVDKHTPQDALEKYKHKGLSVMFSDEFRDEKRTREFFVFEDMPYGVPGNTGDVNIVSTYSSDMVEMIPGGGLRLKAEMAAESYVEFMKGFDPATGLNSNYDTEPELWDWKAPKVTSRLHGRFQYGLVEVSLKAPKGYGPWPAAWMNGCYGFVSEASGEFLLQEDYPFICGQFWPPELDFFEHFSPEHTWFWRPNSQSVHSPNQYVGLGRNATAQGGYCPTTLAEPGAAWCFGVSGAGVYRDDPTERSIVYAMHWEPEAVSYYMDGQLMVRFTREQLVLYLSGQLRPISVPEVPMFLIFNVALMRRGMDASHMGPGLTSPDNFDPTTGAWKQMAMDIAWVRVYQADDQGDTRGLNPPITYETHRKLLANRVTCDLTPELRCLIKNSTSSGEEAILAVSCARLRELGDDYCDRIPYICSLNNAANPTGTYGLEAGFQAIAPLPAPVSLPRPFWCHSPPIDPSARNGPQANLANQRLSLYHGVCCIDNVDLANEHANCRDTPKTKLPQWLLDSEYFQEPRQPEEGLSTGVAGTNPAGWRTFGRGMTENHLIPVPKPVSP